MLPAHPFLNIFFCLLLNELKTHRMKETVETFAEWAAYFTEVLGILVIVSLACYSVIMAAVDVIRRKEGKKVYEKYRHSLARGILFGLELLVAADIINTVALNLDFSNVGVLALIILVRTFLSFTLNVEATGKWPWQEQG
jgi:uncharacterized membrane protein